MVTDTIDARRRPLLAQIVAAHPQRSAIVFVVVLTILRFVAAGSVPLSFDESYFWLWSKNLALSYYDHPPMIALAIRLGTILFGDTPFGVRFVSCVLSVVAAWSVWRAAATLLRSEGAGASACCLFSATLMFASQSMAAIPDALVLAASSILLLCTAKLLQSQDGRWWVGIGAALGFAFLSKYTAFFLAAGVALWAVSSQQGRVWLRFPWPWIALAIALGCFVPNLVWNAAHGWVSFKFQFGRVVAGRPTLVFLAEFVAAQFALASPFILVPALIGLIRASRSGQGMHAATIAACVVWPALLYFAIHAVHSRVQGNWPSFVYPALAVLAASAMNAPATGAATRTVLAASRILALPVASAILAASYLQTWIGILPLGDRDPIARMTAVGIAPIADQISAVARRDHASIIITTSYIATGWLSFYLSPRHMIVPITEEARWLQAPRATSQLLSQPLLYVTQNPRQELPFVSKRFSGVRLDEVLTRRRDGIAIDQFYVFSLSGFHGHTPGRIANAGSS